MAETLLNIEALGRRGEGIARHEGRALFVPGTLPGERVTATGEGERLVLADVQQASPDRIAPFCKHYGRCGGCQLQHWREEPYRAWKAALLTDALRARGIVQEVTTCIDAHGAGRRRVSLHVRKGGGTVTAGYMEPRSHTLLDIDHCPILEPALAAAFDIGRALGAKLGDCDVSVTATLTSTTGNATLSIADADSGTRRWQNSSRGGPSRVAISSLIRTVAGACRRGSSAMNAMPDSSTRLRSNWASAASYGNEIAE